VVTGVELVVGYPVGWAVRKARRVAGRAVYGNTFTGPAAFQVGDHDTQHDTYRS
jgi:hypothetical protein